MSITFFADRDQETEWQNALDVYANLEPEHFYGDSGIDWRDGVPYIEMVVNPECRYTNSTALAIVESFGWERDYTGSATPDQIREAMKTPFWGWRFHRQEALERVFQDALAHNTNVVWC